MNKLFTSDKVYVKNSKIKGAGRGVFARCDIQKDEIIEQCPVIEVSKHDTSKLNESILTTYFFYFGKRKERLAIVLGFGSIYNHSHTPNATFSIKNMKRRIDFTAVKKIKKDSEITFDYYHGDDPKGHKTPLWFEV
jgi:uncharacterized protein